MSVRRATIEALAAATCSRLRTHPHEALDALRTAAVRRVDVGARERVVVYRDELDAEPDDAAHALELFAEAKAWARAGLERRCVRYIARRHATTCLRSALRWWGSAP